LISFISKEEEVTVKTYPERHRTRDCSETQHNTSHVNLSTVM